MASDTVGHEAQHVPPLSVARAIVRSVMPPAIWISATLLIVLPDVLFVHPYLHDTTGWIYPIRKWFVREIHDGYLPIWMNATRYGWSTIELQSTAWVWSPVALVIGFFTPDFDASMLSLEFVVWRIAAASGTYLWVRQSCSPFIASASALTYVYSYFMIDLEKQITMYIGYALIPWVLYCAHTVFQPKHRVRSIWIMVLVLLTLLWSAYPGVWVVCVVPIAAYYAVLALRTNHPAWRRSELLVLALSVLIATVGLFPLIARFATSGLFGGGVRASMDWSPDQGALSDAAVVPCVVGSWGALVGMASQHCLGEFSTVGLASLGLVLMIRPRPVVGVGTQLIASTLCLLCIYTIATERAVGAFLRNNIPIYYQIRWYSVHINLIILMLINVYAIAIEALTQVIEASQTYTNARARWRESVRIPSRVGGPRALLLVGQPLTLLSVVMNAASVIGFGWEESATWDWSRRADRMMEAYRLDYASDSTHRLTIDVDRNILNLLAGVPHMVFYRGLLPELETVDRYWGSPSLFQDFLVFPEEWHAATATDVTISREAMRGERTSHRDPSGWGVRTCPAGREGLADVIEIAVNRSSVVQGKIITECSAFAVWMDTYDEGWRIWINGKRVALYRVNNAVRGFEITPGNNVFVMTYSSLRAAWYRIALLGRA